MGSSNAGVSDDDSITISDEDDATTETDMDVDSKDSAVESPAALNSTPFHEGEKVLAFHSQQLYEAKVKRVDLQIKERRYYVHYLGWNKNWDEWVGKDRLMKFTEDNVQKQKALKEKHGMEKTLKPGYASQMKPKNPTVTRSRKRKIETKKGTAPLEKLINVEIPPLLKKQLVDYCEFITHLGKLVRLPRSPSVDDILTMYLEYRLKKDGMLADSVAEILSGLRCYFEKALPAILLYKVERQQYEEAITDNVSPSTVYGAEHLLRLFVKLPEILYHANIEEETMAELQQELQEFLKFLQENQNTFFLSTCKTPEGFHTSTKEHDH